MFGRVIAQIEVLNQIFESMKVDARGQRRLEADMLELKVVHIGNSLHQLGG